MHRQGSQTSSASTVEHRREAVPAACAPETRRLLRWGTLGVTLMVVVSAFTWWWAMRLISPPGVAENFLTSTRPGNLVTLEDYGSNLIFLHRMNIQDPPVLLSRHRKTKRPKAYSRCPQDDEYGSVCDYEKCSAREEAAKSILLWNTRWMFAPEWTNEAGVSGLVACAPRDCFVAVAPTAVPPEAYDAVVFDMGDAANSPHPAEGPIRRSCFQRYVFLMVQYPQSVSSWDNWLFNWTMTYRLDSDVPLAVGRVVPRAGARVPEAGWKQPTGEHAAKMNNMTSDAEVLTWLTSCEMEDENTMYNTLNFMQTLSTFVKIRIFRLRVDFWSKEMWLNFYTYITTTKYKFYLVFEFPQCNHFAASHVFRVLQADMVPVVFGSANYTALLPPFSYIDGSKFKSPAHLGSYLLYLLRHPRQYAKYFWWKKYFEVQINTTRDLCQLCARLHADDEPKSYENVLEWVKRGVV